MNLDQKKSFKIFGKSLFIACVSLILFQACMSGSRNTAADDFPTPDENTRRVEKVISKNKDEIDHCFKERKLKTAVLKGEVKVFLVDNGKITNIKVLNQNWKDPLLDRCIKQTVNAWDFSKVRIPQDLEAGHTFPITYKR